MAKKFASRFAVLPANSYREGSRVAFRKALEESLGWRIKFSPSIGQLHSLVFDERIGLSPPSALTVIHIRTIACCIYATGKLRESEQIRRRINKEVGGMWRDVSKERKSEVLSTLLKDPECAEALIRKVWAAPAKQYDQDKDSR